MTVRIIKHILGMEGGLCDQVRRAADDLKRTAKDLRRRVETYEGAADPFGTMLSTMWNNHEDKKLNGSGVDIGKSRVYRHRPSNLA